MGNHGYTMDGGKADIFHHIPKLEGEGSVVKDADFGEMLGCCTKAHIFDAVFGTISVIHHFHRGYLSVLAGSKDVNTGMGNLDAELVGGGLRDAASYCRDAAPFCRDAAPYCRDAVHHVSTVRPLISVISNVTAPGSVTVKLTSVVPQNGLGLFCERPKVPLSECSVTLVPFCIIKVVSGQ